MGRRRCTVTASFAVAFGSQQPVSSNVRRIWFQVRSQSHLRQPLEEVH